jgi:hypothetical protein
VDALDSIGYILQKNLSRIGKVEGGDKTASSRFRISFSGIFIVESMEREIRFEGF